MRRFLLVLGAAFLGLVILAIGGFGYLAFVGRGMDQDAQAYVNRAVPAIAADWSVAALERRAGPDLSKVKPDDLRTAFALFRKLGPLVEYRGCKGQTNISVTTGSGEVVTGRYVAQAVFEHGNASIDILVMKTRHGWTIDGWHVNSTAMMERAAGRSA